MREFSLLTEDRPLNSGPSCPQNLGRWLLLLHGFTNRWQVRSSPFCLFSSPTGTW